MPVASITNLINRKYKSFICESTVYRWIHKFPILGFSDTMALKPAVGDVWLMNETIIKILGEKFIIFDLMDMNTRFLLSTSIFSYSDAGNINGSLQIGIAKAGKIPTTLVLLKRYRHNDAIELPQQLNQKCCVNIVYGYNSTCLRTKFFSFYKRDKLFHGIKKMETIQKIINSWIFHYNYRKNNRGLLNKSPAEKALNSKSQMRTISTCIL